MALRFDPSPSQRKNTRSISPIPVAKTTPSKSPDYRTKKFPSDFFLVDILRDNGLLENPQKVKLMTREYLIHYIINFFESYIKQKEPAQIPAVYFIRYLEMKKTGLTSLKSVANSVALSLSSYVHKSQEVNFFYEVFTQKKPVIKMLVNYMHCRRVVKNFFQSKETLDDLKIPLHIWPTIVRKIFKDKPGDLVVERLKEKISSNNRQKLLDASAYDPHQRNVDFSTLIQHPKLDVDAIYFIILCLGEFQNIQNSNREKSPDLYSQNSILNTSSHTTARGHQPQSHPHHQRNISDTVKINPARISVKNDVPIIFVEEQAQNFTYTPNFDIYSKKQNTNRNESREYLAQTPNLRDRDNSPFNMSTMSIPGYPQPRQDKIREGHHRTASEVHQQSIIINSANKPLNLNKAESQEQDELYNERVGLKKELSVQTTEKRVSLNAMLHTIDQYEDLAEKHKKAYSNLKQMQSDFSLLLSKLKISEPQTFRDIDPNFVEKFILNRPEELKNEKTKVVSNIKYRFDPKAAYRATPKKTQLSAEEDEEKPAYSPITLENFHSQVLTPGSKSFKGDQTKGALSNQDQNSATKFKIGYMKQYDPETLDETQKLILSLYPEVIVPPKEAKKVEVEQPKKSANNVVGKVTKQVEVVKKPEIINKGYKPAGYNYDIKPKNKVPIQQQQQPQAEIYSEESNYSSPKKSEPKTPIVTETKVKPIVIPQKETIITKPKVPENKEEKIVEKKKEENVIIPKEKTEEVKKAEPKKESPKKIESEPIKPVNPIVVQKQEEVIKEKPVEKLPEPKPVIKEEEKKPEEVPLKKTPVVEEPKKVTEKPVDNTQKTTVAPVETTQKVISQPEIQAKMNHDNNVEEKKRGEFPARKQSLPQEKPQPNPVSNSNSKPEKPIVVESHKNVPVQPVENKKPAVEISQRDQALKAFATAKPVERTKPKADLPPAGATPIAGQLPPPPKISVSLGIQIVMGNKFDQILEQNADLKRLHEQILAENLEKAKKQSKPVVVQPVQQAQMTQVQSQATNLNIVKGQLGNPPQISIAHGIKIVMGAKFDQLIAQDANIAALHQKLLEKKLSKEQPQPEAQSSQSQNKPAPVQQQQASNLNIVKGELAVPPKISVPHGIKIVMGAKFDQLIAQDPNIAALHQKLLEKKVSQEQAQTQVSSSQSQSKPVVQQASNLNIIKGELAVPPKISIPHGIKIVMGAKFDQLIAQDANIAALHEKLLQKKMSQEQSQVQQQSQVQSQSRPAPVQQQAGNVNIIKGELPVPPKISVSHGIKIVMGAKFDQLIAQDATIAALHQKLLEKKVSQEQAQVQQQPVVQSQASSAPAQQQAGNANIIKGELPAAPKISIPHGIKIVMGAKFDQLIAQDANIAALHQKLLEKKVSQEQTQVQAQAQAQVSSQLQSKPAVQQQSGNPNIIKGELPTPPKISAPHGIKIVMGAKFDQLIAQDASIAALHQKLLEKKVSQEQSQVQQHSQVQSASVQQQGGNANIIKGELPAPPKISVPHGIKIAMGAKFDQLIAQDPSIAALHEKLLEKKVSKEQAQVQAQPQASSQSQPKAAAQQSGNMNMIKGELATPPQISIPHGIKIAMGAKFDQLIAQDANIAVLHEKLLQKKMSQEQAQIQQQPVVQSQASSAPAQQQAGNANIIKGELPVPPKISVPHGIKIVMGAKFDQLIAEDPNIATLHQQLLQKKFEPKNEAVTQPPVQQIPSQPKPSASQGPQLIKGELPTPPKITLAPGINLVNIVSAVQPKPSATKPQQVAKPEIQVPVEKVVENAPIKKVEAPELLPPKEELKEEPKAQNQSEEIKTQVQENIVPVEKEPVIVPVNNVEAPEVKSPQEDPKEEPKVQIQQQEEAKVEVLENKLQVETKEEPEEIKTQVQENNVPVEKETVTAQINNAEALEVKPSQEEPKEEPKAQTQQEEAKVEATENKPQVETKEEQKPQIQQEIKVEVPETKPPQEEPKEEPKAQIPPEEVAKTQAQENTASENKPHVEPKEEPKPQVQPEIKVEAPETKPPQEEPKAQISGEVVKAQTPEEAKTQTQELATTAVNNPGPESKPVETTNSQPKEAEPSNQATSNAPVNDDKPVPTEPPKADKPVEEPAAPKVGKFGGAKFKPPVFKKKET